MDDEVHEFSSSKLAEEGSSNDDAVAREAPLAAISASQELAAKSDGILTVDDNENSYTNVGKMLANSDDLASRPYRIRTCDTLIKSILDFFQDFGLLPKLEPA